MPLKIGVPRESYPGEKRVATVPEIVEKLIKLGFTVAVQSGAGDAANFGENFLAWNCPYGTGLDFLKTPRGFQRPEMLNFAGTQAFSNFVGEERS